MPNPRIPRPDVNLIMSLIPQFGLRGRKVQLHFVAVLHDVDDVNLNLQGSKVTLINKELKTVKFDGYINNHNIFVILNCPVGIYTLKIKNSFLNHTQDIFIDEVYSGDIQEIELPDNSVKTGLVTFNILSSIDIDSEIIFTLKSTNQKFTDAIEITADEVLVKTYNLPFGEYSINLKDYWINIKANKEIVIDKPAQVYDLTCTPVDLISKMIFKGRVSGSFISQMLVTLREYNGINEFEYLTDSHGSINISVPAGRYQVLIDRNGPENNVDPEYLEIDMTKTEYLMEVF